jgi:parallel beta-helix repeat protein
MAISRRALLAGAAASAAAPAAADAAQPSGLFVVVDAAGGGDYTDIEEAVAATPPNSTIFVKNGNYQVHTGDMDPAAGVRLIGEGRGSHIRARDGLDTNVFFISHPNVVLERLRVDGNGANQTYASGNCISYRATTGGKVLNCYVQESPGYNLVGFSCTELVFDGNWSFDSREEAIELHGCSHCTIVNNSVYNALNGIVLWNADADCGWCSVLGNTVVGSSGYGIVVTDRGHDAAIVGNTVHGSKLSGITLNIRAEAIAVNGNVSTGNGGHGIQLDRVLSCTVSRNVVRGNALAGISLNVTESCTVHGNVVTANGHDGVHLDTQPAESARGNRVSANVCVGNGRKSAGRAGVGLFGPIDGAIVANNRCYDSQATATQTNGVAAAERPAPSPQSRNLLLGPNLVDGNRTTGLSVSVATPQAFTVPYRRVSSSVGPGETAVPHGLPYVPRTVELLMTSGGQAWSSRAPDGTNVYLTADAPGRTVEVLAG